MYLVSHDNEILHKPCSVIPKLDNNFMELVNNMFYFMKKQKGIGLAAPQIGVSERFFIMSYGGQDIVCINPKILEFSDTVILMEEGCLTYPDQYVNIKRPDSVKVSYTDLKGTNKKTRFKDMKARIFQHEFDHLCGLTFLDRV